MIRKANSPKAKETISKFLILTGEIGENVYKPIRKQQIKNFEICNSAFCNPVGVQNLLRLALSLTVSEIMANLY